jgi:hypothetical protein
MTKHKIEVHEGSGNVFADLGLPNAEERLLKANIVAELASPYQTARAYPGEGCEAYRYPSA